MGVEKIYLVSITFYSIARVQDIEQALAQLVQGNSRKKASREILSSTGFLFSKVGVVLQGFDLEKNRTLLHNFSSGGHEFCDAARDLRLNFVKDLHRFNKCNHLPRVNYVSN